MQYKMLKAKALRLLRFTPSIEMLDLFYEYFGSTRSAANVSHVLSPRAPKSISGAFKNQNKYGRPVIFFWFRS